MWTMMLCWSRVSWRDESERMLRMKVKMIGDEVKETETGRRGCKAGYIENHTEEQTQ